MHRLFDIQREIEDAFTELIDTRWSSVSSSTWSPGVDVCETHDAYLLSADLPGVEPDDVELRVEDDGITLSGSRVSQSAERSGRHILLERLTGRFRRHLRIDHDIDDARIESRMVDGVLYAVLPKREEDTR